MKAITREGVRVFLDFGGLNGWRISEPIGTMKYMSPAPVMKKGAAILADQLQTASQIASFAPGGAAVSNWMDAAGKLGATSLPQGKGFKWSVTATTNMVDLELRYRITWTIPKDMFQSLSGRISGGLAVTFIDAPVLQETDTSGTPVDSRTSPPKETYVPTGCLYLSAEINCWGKRPKTSGKEKKLGSRFVRRLTIPNKPIKFQLHFSRP
jgi:hypothetical protein